MASPTGITVSLNSSASTTAPNPVLMDKDKDFPELPKKRQSVKIATQTFQNPKEEVKDDLSSRVIKESPQTAIKSIKISEGVICFKSTEEKKDEKEVLGLLEELARKGAGIHETMETDKAAIPFTQTEELMAKFNKNQEEFKEFENSVRSMHPEFKRAYGWLQKLEKCFVKDQLLTEKLMQKFEENLEAIKTTLAELQTRCKISPKDIEAKKEEIEKKEQEIRQTNIQNSIVTRPPTTKVITETNNEFIKPLQDFLLETSFLSNFTCIFSEVFSKLSESDKALQHSEKSDFVNSPLLTSETVKYYYLFTKASLDAVQEGYKKLLQKKESITKAIQEEIALLEKDAENKSFSKADKEHFNNQINQCKGFCQMIELGCKSVTKQIDKVNECLAKWKTEYKLGDLPIVETIEQMADISLLNPQTKEKEKIPVHAFNGAPLNSDEVAQGFQFFADSLLKLREKVNLCYLSIDELKNDKNQREQKNIEARLLLRQKLYIKVAPLFEPIQTKESQPREPIQTQANALVAKMKKHQLNLRQQIESCTQRMQKLSLKWEAIISTQDKSAKLLAAYEQEYKKRLAALTEPSQGKQTSSFSGYLPSIALPSLWSKKSTEQAPVTTPASPEEKK